MDTATLRIAINTGDVKKANDELDKLTRTSKATETAAGGITKSFNVMNVAIAGIGIGAIASKFIHLADTMTGIQSKLKLVTSSTQELTTAQNELFKIAQNTRQGFAETVDTYSNFAVAMGDMGKSQKEILRVTETVNKAIAISGGTAQQAAAATMQLGQAFASGTLRGDELNSILENSKGLAKAIADGMGVPIGKLRTLGSEGKITAEILATALERSAKSVDDKFGKVGVTVEQSMTMAQNSIMNAVGEFDKLNGVSAKVAKTIQDFSKYLDANNDSLDESLRITKNLAYTAGAFYGTTLAVTGVKALVDVTAGVRALTTAQIAMNVAAWANPWVILAGAIAGATYALSEYKDLQEQIDANNAKSAGSTAFLADLKSVQGKSHKDQLTGIVARSKALENEQKQLIATYQEHKKYAYQGSKNDEAQSARQERIKAISAEQSELVKYSNTLKDLMVVKKEDAKIDPLVDTTPKPKKEKKGKSDAQREEERLLEEKRQQEEKDKEYSLQNEIEKYQLKKKNIEDIKQAESDAMTDNAVRFAELLSDMETPLEKLNNSIINDYNLAVAMFGGEENIPQEFFDSLLVKFEDFNEKVKEKLDFSITIDFDTEGEFKSVSKIAKSMTKMVDETEQYNKNREISKDNAVELAKVEHKHEQSQIAGYANMAGAMSDMFEQGSKEAAAFRAIESGLAVVAGVRAIMTAGTGDPYTAIPRMVAMAAMVASTLQSAGIAFGGGTKVTTTSDAFSSMAANEGKGSVLGDATAQSESIANSMEILGDLAKPEFRIMSEMAKSLESIDQKLGGVSSLLLQEGGFSFGEGFTAINTTKKSSVENGINKAIDKTLGLIDKSPLNIGGIISNAFLASGSALISKIAGGLFGKTSVSQTMTDSGIYFADALIQNAIDEFNGSAYQTISTTVSKKSWFSKSSSTSVSTYFEGLNDEVERQFSLVLSGLYDTTLLAGQALDTSSESIAQDLSDFVVSIGKISLKGKTGDQIQETLSSIFGKIADDIALDVFPLLTPFQKVGEGLFETMTRVASGMEEAEYYISRLGIAFNDVVYSDLINKQGDVALEALRQSILELEGTAGGVSEIIQSLSGDAEEMYSTYASLDRLRFSLTAIGTNIAGLTSSMLYGAGGITALDDATQTYIENYLSESEQVAYNTSVMTDAFKDIGLTIPTTKQGFTDLLKSIDVTTESGQELYGRMILLSDGFNELVDSSDNIKSSLFENIKSFIDSISGSTSLDASAVFGTFSTSFNDMIDAIANGSANLEEVGQTALNNAQNYLNTVTATATAGRDVQFAKAILVNKFSGVIATPDASLSTINDTLRFSLGESGAIATQLKDLREQVRYLNDLNQTNTATNLKILSTSRSILGETVSA